MIVRGWSNELVDRPDAWWNARKRTTCRACDGTDLTSVLDLGKQPLANAFLREDQIDDPEVKYPLEMVRCLTCGLCQLTVVVDPEVLYRDYRYESGHAAGWHQHCEALAQEISDRYPDGTVLDIACNDGTLLRHCRDRGLSVLGVDPARNLDAGDIPVIQEFWSIDTVRRLGPGHVSVVVAQNVFGHVDDCRGFLEGIARALAPGGVAIIECPWVVDLLHHRRWDTIYHEHLSYWGLIPLSSVANRVGLSVVDTRYFPDLHGGTMRYCLSAKPDSYTIGVLELWESEPEWLEPIVYERFRDSVQIEIAWWGDYFSNVNGHSVAAYGASAKLNTFLNALPFKPPIVGVFDDNPRKWNLYTPGHHLPVLAPTKMTMRETDVLLVGAPNWAPAIEEKAKALGFTGEIKSLWRA